MKVALLGLLQSGKSTILSAVSGKKIPPMGSTSIEEAIVPVPDTVQVSSSMHREVVTVDPFAPKRSLQVNMLQACTPCSDLMESPFTDLFYVDAVIDGGIVKMLLDTGSTSTILEKSYLNHPKAQRCTNPYMVLLAANHSKVRVIAHLTLPIVINYVRH